MAHYLERLASFSRLIRFDNAARASPTDPVVSRTSRRGWTTCGR